MIHITLFLFVLHFTRIESWHEKIPTDYKSNDKVERLVCEINPYPGKGIINYQTY